MFLNDLRNFRVCCCGLHCCQCSFAGSEVDSAICDIHHVVKVLSHDFPIFQKMNGHLTKMGRWRPSGLVFGLNLQRSNVSGTMTQCERCEQRDSSTLFEICGPIFWASATASPSNAQPHQLESKLRQWPGLARLQPGHQGQSATIGAGGRRIARP